MKIWQYVVLVVVFGTYTTSLIYGITCDSKHEPGLMQVCWIAGHASFAKDCEPKVELKWEKSAIPLQVYLGFLEKECDKNIVIEALKLWNAELKFEVFQPTIIISEANVFVSHGTKVGNKVATTQFWGYGKPQRADIILMELSDVNAIYRFAVHEFGHVLGLAHDEHANSVMYPFAPVETDGVIIALPSDNDVRLLRKIYGK